MKKVWEKPLLEILNVSMTEGNDSSSDDSLGNSTGS